DRWEYAGRARSLTIPLTLRDSLMARLDRFTPVKEIAQNRGRDRARVQLGADRRRRPAFQARARPGVGTARRISVGGPPGGAPRWIVHLQTRPRAGCLL